MKVLLLLENSQFSSVSHMACPNSSVLNPALIISLTKTVLQIPAVTLPESAGSNLLLQRFNPADSSFHSPKPNFSRKPCWNKAPPFAESNLPISPDAEDRFCQNSKAPEAPSEGTRSIRLYHKRSIPPAIRYHLALGR